MSIFSTEKEFENQLYNYIEAHKVNPCNGREVVSCHRQVNLGAYGVADVICLEKHGQKLVINVIELKNVTFSSGMLFQIARYIEAIKLGLNYKLLGMKIFDFDLDDAVILNENISVIGSIICVGTRELTDGEESAFSALKVTVYNFWIEMLAGYFEPVNNPDSYKSGEVKSLNETVRLLIQEN